MLVWFRPIKPLVIIEIMITIKINKENFKLYMIKIIGAIFCHVNIKNLLNQFNPSIISGNQKWNGAAPIFVKNEEFIIILRNSLEFWGINSNSILIIMIENNKIIEAKA